MCRRPCFYVFGLSSGPFDLPLTKMGSRASCVSLAHRHSGAMLPIRLTRRRSVVGPSPPRLQIPLSGCAFARLQAAHGIRPISLTLRQNSPGNTCHLVGHGDRRDVHMRSLLQSVCPSRYRRRPVTPSKRNLKTTNLTNPSRPVTPSQRNLKTTNLTNPSLVTIDDTAQQRQLPRRTRLVSSSPTSRRAPL